MKPGRLPSPPWATGKPPYTMTRATPSPAPSKSTRSATSAPPREIRLPGAYIGVGALDCAPIPNSKSSMPKPAAFCAGSPTARPSAHRLRRCEGWRRTPPPINGEDVTSSPRRTHETGDFYIRARHGPPGPSAASMSTRRFPRPPPAHSITSAAASLASPTGCGPNATPPRLRIGSHRLRPGGSTRPKTTMFSISLAAPSTSPE